MDKQTVTFILREISSKKELCKCGCPFEMEKVFRNYKDREQLEIVKKTTTCSYQVVDFNLGD